MHITPGTASSSSSSSTGTIIDGVNSAISATVLDYSNSNPLAVRLSDVNGDYVTAGGGTEYTEDAASAANPVGGMLIARRRDTPVITEVSAEGDNIALITTSKGALWTQSIYDVSNNSLLDSINSVIANVDKTIVVDDNAPNTSAIMAGFIFDDIAPNAADEGDGGFARMSANRNQYMQIRDGGGNERGAYVNSSGQLTVTVDNTVTVASHAVTNAGTFATQVDGAALTSLQLIDDAIYTDGSGTLTKGVGILGQDGTNPQAIKTDSSGELQVDVLTMPTVAVTQSGTWDEVGINDSGNSITVDGTITEASASGILTSVQLIDDTVFTDDTSTHSTGSTKGIGIMAAAAPTDTAVNANDIGMVGMTVNRELYAYHLSGSIASGAVASGAVASGAFASGSIASGALAAGSIAVGAIAAGDTSIATTEDTASAGGEHILKIGASRLDTPVANAGVSNDGDYTGLIVDNFRKQWVTGTVPEDTAHVAGEAITVTGSRRIDTLATSAGTSADWATVNQTAEGAAWATLAPTTTSGLLVANFTSGDTYTALTNTAQVIKATAGNLYGYYFYNPNATISYVMIYNVAAASVTVGTTTAQMVFAVPATSGGNVTFPYPISFSNAGWSISAATTGGGNTAPATALEVMIYYL